MPKERLDKLLVDKGLVATRQKAQALIIAGQVLVDEQREEKPGKQVDSSANLRIKGEQLRYVGRGGLKLEHALKEFGVSVDNLVCVDIGASTGGFTDCLLQHGAAHVTAIDVGHNQLDWKIRQDERVTVREGVNARYLTPTDFPERTLGFDLATIDVSFISLEKILPAVAALVRPGGTIAALIKPQFEVGKDEVGKGGIVTDPAKQEAVVERIKSFAQNLGLNVKGVIDSPILGQDGNREFLIHLGLP
ncbi:MAG TPA: TlyA family RNA methyltransferase [Blastocatellia bacterium]|nr:TlyA family RNA methyltransferase [Blastocatellia bacterium]